MPSSCIAITSLELGSSDKEGPFGYNLFLLKIENWKRGSKIIFECVNSAVEPIFNKKNC